MQPIYHEKVEESPEEILQKMATLRIRALGMNPFLEQPFISNSDWLYSSGSTLPDHTMGTVRYILGNFQQTSTL